MNKQNLTMSISQQFYIFQMYHYLFYLTAIYLSISICLHGTWGLHRMSPSCPAHSCHLHLILGSPALCFPFLLHSRFEMQFFIFLFSFFLQGPRSMPRCSHCLSLANEPPSSFLYLNTQGFYGGTLEQFHCFHTVLSFKDPS